VSTISSCSCLGTSRFCRGGGGDYVSTTEEAGAGNQLAVQETSARLSRGQVGDTWPTRVKKLNLRYGGPEWVCE
jgi:hypothetical protein